MQHADHRYCFRDLELNVISQTYEHVKNFPCSGSTRSRALLAIIITQGTA
jgi:hypothetical protein